MEHDGGCEAVVVCMGVIGGVCALISFGRGWAGRSGPSGGQTTAV
jgi:hypothetical protein